MLVQWIIYKIPSIIIFIIVTIAIVISCFIKVRDVFVEIFKCEVVGVHLVRAVIMVTTGYCIVQAWETNDGQVSEAQSLTL